MRRVMIFLSIVWRKDDQYGFIDWSLAWTLSGILNENAEELAEWERL
jgi:hypothetical protein